eukprot:8786433-Pyramimonas_sp.AAC.1
MRTQASETKVWIRCQLMSHRSWPTPAAWAYSSLGLLESKVTREVRADTNSVMCFISQFTFSLADSAAGVGHDRWDIN